MYGEDGSSEAIARDMNFMLHSSTFKHPPDSEFAKIKDLISADSHSSYNHHKPNHNYSRNENQNHNQSEQTESSLMRYCSAPSSFYAGLLDESGCDDFLNPVETSNQAPDERFFDRDQNDQQHIFQSDSHEFLKYASSSTSTNIETKEEENPKVNLRQESPAMYGGSSHQMPPSNTNGSYSRDNLGRSATLRTMNTTSSNLMRQTSSPAGFLSSLDAETDLEWERPH